MQLHQLEYFVAIAETGSFTRGAERAHVVQSAVSAAIRSLEAELGVDLFERKHRAIALTAEGVALLPHARGVLIQLAAAVEAVEAVRGDVVGTVTLGTMAHMGSFDVAGVLAQFHERYPRVAVRLRQTASGSRTSLEEVRSGTLDLALVSPAIDRAPGIELDPILSEALFFVCWPGHRLADHETVSATEVAGETYIDFPGGWGNRDVVDRLFETLGLQRTITTEVTDFALALALVRRRLGVTIIPKSGAPADGSVVAVPLVGTPDWTVRLARPAGRTLSVAAEKLAETILLAAS